MKILGVRIDNLFRREILKNIEGFLAESKCRQLATINPEFILRSQKDEEFKNILNTCELNIADGIGIKFAFWRFGKNLRTRIAGIDLMWEVLKMANRKNLTVFLAAEKNGLSSWQETAAVIHKIYPNLKIKGANLFKNDWRCAMRNARCAILFCNFGAPDQEKFINSLKKRNKNISLAMGVGGSFDFIAGKVRRAPIFMRKLGFEWLWRLFQQKEFRIKRARRIFQSVVIFTIRVLMDK